MQANESRVLSPTAPNLSPARQGALPNGSLMPGEDKFCICANRYLVGLGRLLLMMEIGLSPEGCSELHLTARFAFEDNPSVPANRLFAGRTGSEQASVPANRLFAGRTGSEQASVPANRLFAGRTGSEQASVPANRLFAGRTGSEQASVSANLPSAGRTRQEPPPAAACAYICGYPRTG